MHIVLSFFVFPTLCHRKAIVWKVEARAEEQEEDGGDQEDEEEGEREEEQEGEVVVMVAAAVVVKEGEEEVVGQALRRITMHKHHASHNSPKVTLSLVVTYLWILTHNNISDLLLVPSHHHHHHSFLPFCPQDQGTHHPPCISP